MSLEEYRKKRDFSKTAEPSGETPGEPQPKQRGASIKGETGRFVVQEHHASQLHWDFRLELEGVLKSWAVPKGIPEGAGQRRLAVHVEDHPLEYIDFAGQIDEGYGAGTVKIWDSGTFNMASRRPEKLVFNLSGERLRGDYVLVHTGGKNWLIFKKQEIAEACAIKLDEKRTEK